MIFTTAYDEYALRAFEVNSIDYLMKPIEPEQLARALKKLDRLRPAARPDWQRSPDLPALLQRAGRIAARRAGRVSAPHRLARGRAHFAFSNWMRSLISGPATSSLTLWSTAAQHASIRRIAELERRLDPARFLRIHRSALVNADWIHEVNSGSPARLSSLLRTRSTRRFPWLATACAA